jgi:hypothetical protein
MTSTELAAGGALAVNQAASWRGQAFGVELESSLELVGTRTDGPRRSDRTVAIESAKYWELKRLWPAGEARVVFERRHVSGRVIMRIDAHPETGYRIWAPRYGLHVVSPDGSLVKSALPSVEPWRWQRLLFAQVLPLASLLSGLELFHASAVDLDGRALVFIAPSGTGKTSVAVHLVASGASFLTDDVVAVERSGGEIVVHPGGGLASVVASELEVLSELERLRLGTPIGESEKIHLDANLQDHPTPLGAVYFLHRHRDPGTLKIVGRDSDPRLLLGNSFITYVENPARLFNQLDLCADITGRIPLFGVVIPAACPATEVAAAVRAHAKERR